MDSEERRQKYIEYYKTATPCCKDRQWYFNYAVQRLKEGELRPPHIYDVCDCLVGFGLSSYKN